MNYETTTDFILNHINKMFTIGNNIATALGDEEGKEYDMSK
jgi:hypothetical protein